MAVGSKEIWRHRTGRTLARALVRRYPKPSSRSESTSWSFRQVITEAARTMPPERYDEFALALCDPTPPRWAREERDRIWRQIKRQRNARSAARAA
jgi:hypothetical protein